MIDMICILFTTGGVLFFAFRAVKLDRALPWFRPDILSAEIAGPANQGGTGWRRARGGRPATMDVPAVSAKHVRGQSAATGASVVATAAPGRAGTSNPDRVEAQTRPWRR